MKPASIDFGLVAIGCALVLLAAIAVWEWF